MICAGSRWKAYLTIGILTAMQALPRSAGAAVIAMTFPMIGTYPPLTAGGFNYTQGDYQLGFAFTVAAPITVTELGYYDSTLAGVAEPSGAFGPHTDTLTDMTSGATLATATVDSTDPATGLFRFAALGAPVTMKPGDTYSVQGDSGTDYYAVGVNISAASINPAVIYGFPTGDIFGSPSPPGTLPDFGANFGFTLGPTTCKSNVPGKHVFAQGGDFCVASGAYHPTPTVGILPFADHGYGLVAYGGGYIGASSAVSVATTGASGSYAVWSRDAGSLINLTVPVTITTSGAASYGLYASGGGAITVPDAPKVTTAGAGSVGLYASGAGSMITAGAASITTHGSLAPGVQADGAGAVTLNGGSVTTTGAGSYGLYATGAGSSISGTGGSVTTTNNNAAGLFSTGAGSTITIGGTTVLTDGLGSPGAFSELGATVVINGGSVTTKGDGSAGLGAFLSGSSISATGTTITTEGNVSASGIESVGVIVEGAGATSALANDT
ncbi:MAG: DUF4082 domain-containing protein, partial [Hyphomicrobiales bacterium]|nr:DUF4082 domain-containing protein [Hyphomicrobiales bacterium]